MKKVFKGWIGKSVKQLGHWSGDEDPELVMANIFKRKLKQRDWLNEDWPPVKVKITIEIEK